MPIPTRGAGGGKDQDAIHDNEANEITGITIKVFKMTLILIINLIRGFVYRWVKYI